MNRISVVLATLVVLGVSSGTTKGAVILDTASFGGSTYHLVGGDATGAGINWTDAQAFAGTIGGNLATVDDALEDAFIFSTWGASQFGSNNAVHSLWIGLTDQGVEGTFQWIEGGAVSYTNWSTNEPSNLGAGEDYVAIYGASTAFQNTDSLWNNFFDVSSGVINGPAHPFYGVVEVDNQVVPEPSTAALFFIALGAFSIIRKRSK